MDARNDEIRRFFEDFVAAFAEFDGALIARRYGAPYLALNAAGEPRLFTTATDIGDYFQGIVDAYYAQGCRSCRFHSLEITPLGGAAVLASLSWELLDGGGEAIGAWRESYNLTRGVEGWRIHVSTDHATAGDDT
jgi:ketosteroid isomerase-like protein